MRIRNAVRASLAVSVLLAPFVVYADSAAPALFGVGEVVEQPTHFANVKSADACGLSAQDIADRLDTILQNNKISATAASSAKPPMIGIARIDLVPTVSSVSNETLDCTSWISLTAQSNSNVHVPPVDAPRAVTVTYWHQDTVVSSGQSVHARLVGETLEKMAQAFVQQYKLDQPPGK